MRTLPPPGQRRRRLPRRRLHRTAFLAAGLYNLGWGLYAVVDPQWLFRLARMPLSNHPEVFACLGMVIGLYGVLYLEVARVPERNWPVAAVGMAGKVLGPLGFAQLVLSGAVLHLAIPRQAEAATTVAAQIAKANAPNAAASRWSTGTSTASS